MAGGRTRRLERGMTTAAALPKLRAALAKVKLDAPALDPWWRFASPSVNTVVSLTLPACLLLVAKGAVGLGLCVLAMCAVFVVLEVLTTWARRHELRNRVTRAIATCAATSALVPVAGMRGLLQSRAFGLSIAIRDGKVVNVPACVLVDGDCVVAPRLFDRLCVAPLRRTHEPFLAVAARTLLTQCPLQLQPLELVPPAPLAELQGGQSDSDSDSSVDMPSDIAAGNRTLLESDQDDDDLPRAPLTSSAATSPPAAFDSRPRSTFSPASPPVPHEKMEFLLTRMLCSVAAATWMLLMLLRAIELGGSISTEALVDVTVSVLGFAPLVAVICGRLLTAWFNAQLVCFCKLVSKNAGKIVEDRLHDDEQLHARVDTGKVLRQLRQAIAADGSGTSLCFSRNPVHALSSATVVASLDGDAVLSESTLVPLRIAFPCAADDAATSAVPADAPLGPSSSSSTAQQQHQPPHVCFSFVTDDNAKREMERNRLLASHKNRRGGRSGGAAAKLQQIELHGLPATTTTRGPSVVSFVDQEEVRAASGNLFPIAMCALLHSVHSAQLPRASVRHGDVALMQAMDQTLLWGRSMHWIARALNFDDRLACQYRLLRRVLMLKRRGEVLQHKCALVFETNSELHVYCIGTFDCVLGSCATSWAGQAMSQLKMKDVESARSLRWPRRMATVAVSHKLLPPRFKKWLEPTPDDLAAAAGSKSRSSKSASHRGASSHHHHHNNHNHNNNQHAALDFAEDFFVDTELIYSSSAPRHTRQPVAGAARSAAGHGVAARYFAPRCRTPDVRGSDWTLLGPDAADDATSSHHHMSSHPPHLHRRSASYSRSSSVLPPGGDTTAGLDEGEGGDFSAESVLLSVLEDHTFLGLVGLGTVMHPDVDSHVSSLSDAGVRVVHFSESPLREAKSYGQHIGLPMSEINSCVSLSERAAHMKRGLGFEYKRAQLPCGIAQIRNHLRFFDTIPLHVPMFCDCTGPAIRDMISIMQDNHEIVCAFGAPRLTSVRGMLQADVAFSVDPDPTEDTAAQTEDLANRVNEEPLSHATDQARRCFAQIDQLCGSVSAVSGMAARFGLPLLSMAIREARISAKRIAAAKEFAVQASCAVALLRCLAQLLGGAGSAALSPAATVFLLFVAVPLLTGAVALAAPPRDVMGQMPSKHNFTQRLLMVRGWCTWFALRYMPTILAVAVVCSWGHRECRHAAEDVANSVRVAIIAVVYNNNSNRNVGGAGGRAANAAEQITTECHAGVSTVALGVLVTLLALHSVCHISTYYPLSIFPASGRKSVLLSRGSVAVAALVMVITVYAFGVLPALWSAPSSFRHLTYAALAAACPILLLVDFFAKRTRLGRLQQRQKYLKLVFSTRLGMHSPVGALEDIAPEVAANRPSAEHMGWWTSKLFQLTSLDAGQGETECECCPRPA